MTIFSSVKEVMASFETVRKHKEINSEISVLFWSNTNR